MPKLVVGISGQLLSGKGTAADFFVSKGFLHLRYSRILQNILNVLDLPFSRKHAQDLAVMLKDLYGPNVLTHALTEDGKLSGNDYLVFEGIRTFDELDELKKQPGFKLVYIKAKEENRFNRMLLRKEKSSEDAKTLEEFIERQKHPADKQLAELEAKADFIIENNSTLEDYLAKLESVYAQLIKEQA